MKKFRRFLPVLIFLAFISCEEKPSCTMPEEQLVLVLGDMQVAEAAAQSLIGAVKDSVLEVYYDQIFSIHGVERASFELCFDELQQDPQRLSLIYEKVIEELKRQGAQVDDVEKEKAPED
jgi:hypothetical protein